MAESPLRVNLVVMLEPVGQRREDRPRIR